MTRDNIISRAITECMREMYAKAQPSADYDKLVEDMKTGKIGKDELVFNRHFLSHDEFNYILNKYIDMYRLREEWTSNMDLLIDYVSNGGSKDKWIPDHTKNGMHYTGHRGYEKVDPLKKQFDVILNEYNIHDENMLNRLYDAAINTINDCKDFYKFDREQSSFSIAVALGASPTSNQETVKEYWKSQGVDIDIEIRNPLLFWEQDYYGDDFESIMEDDYGENWREYWDDKWKNKKE